MHNNDLRSWGDALKTSGVMFSAYRLCRVRLVIIATNSGVIVDRFAEIHDFTAVAQLESFSVCLNCGFGE